MLTFTGGFECVNNDYFEGEFFGSINDRIGCLTKITENGCFSIGKWSNGFMDEIFDLTETSGWKRARYKNGLRHGLERKFNGIYPNTKGTLILKRLVHNVIKSTNLM